MNGSDFFLSFESRAFSSIVVTPLENAMSTELETDKSPDKSMYAESSKAAGVNAENSTAETVEQVKRVTAQVVDNLGELPKYFWCVYFR